jgi:hypothetical protein
MTERSLLPEWTQAMLTELGLDTEVDLKLVLDLARDAAHAVERPAAPVTTYLLGIAAATQAGGARVEAADVEAVRDRLTVLAQRWAAERG